jgi:Tol biopolymer transport system component
MNADGSNLKQLTSGWSERWPHISLDGKWVYFISIPEKDGPPRLCKVSIDGGDPIELAVGARLIQDVSQKDGSILYSDQNPGQLKSIKIMSASDPSKIKTVTKPPQIVDGGVLWSFDNRHLIFADRKNPAFHALQTVTLTGKMLPKPIMTLPKGIGAFEWTKDGKQLGFVSGTATSEGVIITNKGN